MKRLLPFLLMLVGLSAAYAQDNTNTTPLSTDDRLRAIEERQAKQEKILNILRDFRIQAYAQPEWQHAQTAGASSFAGGNFPTYANNRFLVRRGRFKLSWQHEILNKKGQAIKIGEFAFQYDASEKGFTAIKDFYGKIIDPWTGWFGLQGGIFLRPFGYESPASPMTHESPEFSRMNQTIMPNECELGEALVIESPRTFKPLYLRFDATMVNGEGIGVAGVGQPYYALQTGTYQSRKDFIGRIIVGKKFMLHDSTTAITFNVSGSYYNGGVMQGTNNVYEVVNVGGVETFKNVTAGTSDTSGKNNAYYKRQYFGAHAQLNFDYKMTKNATATTMLRGEFIAGQQPGQASSNQVPLGVSNAAPGTDLYVRKFRGVIGYFSEGFHYKVGKNKDDKGKEDKDWTMMHSEITLKFDVYNPNTQVATTSVIKTNGFSATDLTYSTLGIGYTFTPVKFFKLMLWYDHVMIANNGLGTLANTVTHQDVFTLRTQFQIDSWWFDKKSTTNSSLINKSF